MIAKLSGPEQSIKIFKNSEDILERGEDFQDVNMNDERKRITTMIRTRTRTSTRGSSPKNGVDVVESHASLTMVDIFVFEGSSIFITD